MTLSCDYTWGRPVQSKEIAVAFFNASKIEQ